MATIDKQDKIKLVKDVHVDEIMNAKLPRSLEHADAIITNVTLANNIVSGIDFIASLSVKELTLLRQATLRAHRRTVGPFGQGDPTIAEIDTMIASLGPGLVEDFIRKAVDEKRGEYDRGRFGHTKANDSTFIDKAKKI